MRKSSILTNFFYQSIFQLVKIAIPIITVPIVSRSLGPSGIGINAFTNSIAQYFILLSGLGINLYGNKIIATNRENKDRLSDTFWEIFYLKFFTTLFSLSLYLVISSIFFNEYKLFMILQSINIIAVLFDISWFFMGIEDFKKTSLVSLYSQLFIFVSIILFIKSEDDIWKYILIQAIGNLLSQVLVWRYIFKEIKFKKIYICNVLFHIKPTLKFFIPQVAVIVYTILNKTILGLITNSTEVGFYTNAVSLGSICITLITTIDLVMLPKMSNLFSNNHNELMDKYLKLSIHIQLLASIPIAFGLIGISNKLVPWFFGDKFDILKIYIPLASPLIVIVPLGMAIARQYLLPSGRTSEYTWSVFLGAIISIILNFILIPYIGIYGAIVATVCSEVFVCFHRVISLLKTTSFRFDYISVAKTFVSSYIMFFSVVLLTKNMVSAPSTTIVQFVLGIVIYFLVNLFLKNEYLLFVIRQLKK
ncbi:polysaccharide biosynthesis family protein [Carnobacterium maltaromaticum LMA28]|uniref:Polysaccharide biosynthesis family protein n=2 Tax=Carnobacterium maltaromaticum TaxID=2751 RepID=K8E5H9_CARML|nr:oligosaccharide flippase family protein [Carnobacterium maltaromaticum]CCO12012.2 polysaccharide biosynthesis family protein [Carnobacterium maltaromaticum LMA28]